LVFGPGNEITSYKNCREIHNKFKRKGTWPVAQKLPVARKRDIKGPAQGRKGREKYYAS
jgi:hypothetical protein